ncbi:ABC transporter substrate-binding protein [Aliidiomarina celeris]|uniref:ABC transporter substrate-binding protein n=1 Tax=Aliidiomarina celeris TaxID=2249428 RepID=UPI000DEBEE53|nr:ABC transporter substrate-binding protein [Aliidiomarina celeris]
MKPNWVNAITLSITALFVAACSPALPPEHNGVLYCAEGNPESFNPQLVTSGTTLDMTSAQLFDRLLEYNNDTQDFEPALATAWEVSNNGLVYEFELRQNVSFHSTDYFTPSRSFNANDVVFSFNRWLQPNHPFHLVSGGNYPFFSATRLDRLILSVEALNSHRIRITLREPDSSLLSILASNFSVMHSQEYAQQMLEAGTPEHVDQFPVGTGPFYFRHFRKDVAVNYSAHEHYWKTRAATDNIVFRITTNDHKRMLMLLTGDCDISPYPPARDVEWLDQRRDIQLQRSLSPNTAFWAFNTERVPFNDARVRQALAHAINRESLIRTVYHEHAVIANSILPDSSWAHRAYPSAYAYDPQRARELLAEAGYENGFSMTIWALPVQRAYNPNARVMAEQMQSYLAQVGVTAQIISYEWSTFRRDLAAGQHDSVLIGWSADHADPDNFFRPLLTCAAKASGNNRAQWCNSDFDEAVTAAIRSNNQRERRAHYYLAQQILSEHVPIVPLAHSIRFQAAAADIRGLKPPTFGGIRLQSVYKEPQNKQERMP